MGISNTAGASVGSGVPGVIQRAILESVYIQYRVNIGSNVRLQVGWSLVVGTSIFCGMWLKGITVNRWRLVLNFPDTEFHTFFFRTSPDIIGYSPGGGRVRNAGLPVITGNTLLAVACEYCRRAPSDFGCLRGSRVQPRQGSDSSRRARDTATTMLYHSRHRGESATKTVKFFAAHTVNYVICKNLTRIEWMLLNFTLVIQQNCHQPGRNFEKSFCAVDRLSCQNPKPATSEAILFLIVNYVHVIFWHGD